MIHRRRASSWFVLVMLACLPAGINAGDATVCAPGPLTGTVRLMGMNARFRRGLLKCFGLLALLAASGALGWWMHVSGW
jgi:hypothetical protein